MPPKGKKPPPPRSPSESSEYEEEEEDEMTIESVDPVDFIKTLSVEKRRRVYALKGITKKYRTLRADLRAELNKLADDFDTEVLPMLEERRKIVAGEREVTEDEIAAGAASADESRVEEIPSDDEDEKADKKKSGKKVKIETPADSAATSALTAAAASSSGGIPGFWLGTLRNNEVVESVITPKDEDALQHLTNVTSEMLPGRRGFKLTFHFSENPFFSNSTLTKTYHCEEPSTTDDGDDGDSIEKTEGCAITWKSPEKNLLVTIKQKKQRHKSGKGVRVVTKEERAESFFWFFYPPYDPEEEKKPEFYPAYAARKEDDELPWDEEEEMDFEIGAALHQNVVRRAAHYYSGKSVEEIAQGIFAMQGDDDDDDDDFDEEEEDEEPVAKGKKSGGKKAGAKPAPKECKQQ